MKEYPCYQMFDEFINGIVVIDDTLSIIYINKALISYTSQSQKRILTKNPKISDVLKTTIGDLWPETIQDITIMEKYREIEFIKTDGNKIKTLVKFEPSSVPQHLGKHWLINIHETHLEISLQTKYREQKDETDKAVNLLEANKEIIQQGQFNALTAMSKGIAHEVNNPLTVIRGKINKVERLLSSTEHNTEEFTANISKIHEMVDRIKDITNGLKIFSHDDFDSSKEKTTFKEIIDTAKSLCEVQLLDHGIELLIASSEKDQEVVCNKSRISQVIFHMLMNSRDAIKNLPEKWIKIGVESSKTLIHISISDSGKGIPVEIQERIFWPFFTTKETGQGTGLGLSSSSGIISQHSGTIKIDTNCENTKFIITLPLK